MNYRAEIDGLRAIAVIPVILFHTGYQWFGGGFIGVDIFFVISGYLITNIIVSEMGDEKFSLLNFYERRARRILPALFLAILISIFLAYYFLLPHQIKDFSQSIVASAFFASNFFFYLETDYFNQFTNKAPLLHTWTLAVEEQFYILFPLLLLAIYRLGKRLINLFLLFILLVSLISAEVIVGENPNLAFYATHTRSWELMVGCLAALNQKYIEVLLVNIKEKFNVGSLIENVLCFLALGGVISSLLFFNKDTRHPSLITLIPVVSTALLLLFSSHCLPIKKLFSWKPLVFVGLLSYSLYIFHQPILSFSHFSSFGLFDEHTWFYRPVLLCIIFIVSFLSYKYVEKPLRYNRSMTQRFVLVGSLTSLMLLAIIGYWGHKNDGFQTYFANKFETDGGVLLVDVDKEKKIIKDFAVTIDSSKNDSKFGGYAKSRVLIIGDSMAGDAYLSLHKYMSENVTGIELRVLYVDDECMAEFVDAINNNLETSCPNSVNVKKAKYLLEVATTVFITAKWQESTYKDGFLLGEYIAKRYPTNIVLVGSILFDDITSVSLGFARQGVSIDQLTSLMYEHIRLDRLTISDKLQELVSKDSRLTWIEKSNFLCNHKERTCQLFGEDRLPFIWDNAHLTYRRYSAYAKFLMPYIK
jgi:peptidoglycan/LPS O-acetylase OafA/YrhL